MTAKQETTEDGILSQNQIASVDKEPDMFAQVAGIMDSLDLSSESVPPRVNLGEPRTGFKFPSLLIPSWLEEGSKYIPCTQVR